MTTSKKIALVTGANKGIGFEVCPQLAGLGFTVLLGSRESSRGMQAAKTLQEQELDVRPVQLDINDPSTFGKLHDLIAADFGLLDVLVNNAGFASDWAYTAANLPIQMLRDTFEVNFLALVDLTQRLLPLIRKSPAGRIVNQSSVLGSLTLHSTPGSGLEALKPLAYNSSKTAVNAFTVHLADALKGTPIKVNSAHPGSVLTEANPSSFPRKQPAPPRDGMLSRRQPAAPASKEDVYRSRRPELDSYRGGNHGQSPRRRPKTSRPQAGKPPVWG